MAAGELGFVVECPSAAIKDAVERLFVDLGSGADRATTSHILIEEAGNGLWTFQVDNGRVAPAQPQSGLFASLVSAVNRLALDSDPSRLHLHCAALGLDNGAVLISAPSGTGKTTLAATLANAGWVYLSDEMVALQPGSQRVTSFAKPMVIKAGGERLLPFIEPVRLRTGEEHEVFRHVPATGLTTTVVSELEPTAIVLLHMGPDGAFDQRPEPVPVHRADAVVALMGQTMDAQRFGHGALAALCELVCRCRCVTLRVGPLQESERALRALVQQGPERASSDAFAQRPSRSAGYSIPDRTASLLVEGRAVLHDTDGGAIAALDEAGTGVWQLLHGNPPPWVQPELLDHDDTASFLDALVDHGFLDRGPGHHSKRSS